LSLRLYNTATRKKEEFRPVTEGKVGIYVCGVTVYDLCHVGHARSLIVFDVLVRYLRARGYRVTYVRNFTDVDDKIIERARELGKDTSLLAKENIDAFYQDMAPLSVLEADAEPRATEHVEDMIGMIETLLERGYAYQAGDNVYFSVERFEDYGRLSGRKLEDMQAGSRIEIDRNKRHPMDFVLWKAAKEGEPWWPSRWGPGRPGWHLECSVMSNRYLGATFDIHGGGRDLLFPHHENERAQSLGANGGNFANYWVHNGFVTVESEKMSKSLGNFLTIRDALSLYHPEVLRLFLISKHYRSPLDFSRTDVLSVQSGLVRIYRTLERLEALLGPPVRTDEHVQDLLRGEQTDPFLAQFTAAMDDDMNTPEAMGLVFERIRELNKRLDSGSTDEAVRRELEGKRQGLLTAGRVLGVMGRAPDGFLGELSTRAEEIDPDEIERMVEERSRARSEKNWGKADEIRDRLKAMGVVLEDGPGGTTWRLDV